MGPELGEAPSVSKSLSTRRERTSSERWTNSIERREETRLDKFNRTKRRNAGETHLAQSAQHLPLRCRAKLQTLDMFSVSASIAVSLATAASASASARSYPAKREPADASLDSGSSNTAPALDSSSSNSASNRSRSNRAPSNAFAAASKAASAATLATRARSSSPTVSSRISRTASRTEAPELGTAASSSPKISRNAGFFAASNAARRSCEGVRRREWVMR